MGIVMVTVLLLLQLTLLPTRSMFPERFGKERPWMKLPVANNRTRCCHCFFGDELSWTRTGGWVNRSGGIDPGELEAFLRHASGKGMGRSYTLRLRIPADAQAGKFMEAAMAAQRAGISCLHVAVVQPR